MLLKNQFMQPSLLVNYKHKCLIIYLLLFSSLNVFANPCIKLVNNFISEAKEIGTSAIINENYLIKIDSVKKPDEEISLVLSKVLQAETHSKSIDNINEQSIALYSEALTLSENSNNQNLIIYVNTQIGFYYYSYNEYIKAMPFFIRASNLLDVFNSKELIEAADVYRKNAYFLDSIGEYEKSIEYLLKALSYTPSNSKLYATFLNNIGSSYYKKGNEQEAREYLIKAKNASLDNNDEVRYAKILGDLALIHFDEKEYQKAIELLQKDIKISIKNNADRNTMYAQILLSKVYVETKNFEKAKQTLALANEYVISKEYLKSHAYEIAQVNLSIALQTNDIALELQSRRALDELGADIVNKDGQEAIKLVGWETQKEQFNTKLEAEKAKVEKANLMIVIISGIVLFIIAVTFFIIRSIQLRFRNKEAQYEKNILQYKINQLQSISKLHDYDLTLKSYQSYLSDQNKHMDLIEKELDKLNTNTVTKDQAKVFLQELLDHQKMSGNNWLALKNTFLKEENDYYNALLENFPDLSEQNLRIVILNKMDLKPAEIALVLNIKIDVVDDALQRLRKNFKGRFDKHSTN